MWDLIEKSELHGVIGRFVEWLNLSGFDFLVNTFAALGVLILGWGIHHFVRGAIVKSMRKRGLLANLRIRLFVNLGTCFWWVLVVYCIIRCYDFNVLPALAGLGVVGIVVGFAFQETLSSLAAGAMLAISEPFSVGDEVSIANYTGFVTWFGYASTQVRTYDNRIITIPNKNVWGMPIVNFTRMDLRRVDRTVGVSYGTDLDKACKVAKEAILSVPGILKDPEPKVFVSGLADSSVTLTLWPWCKTKDYWSVWENSYIVLKKAFDQNGIAIPFPQMDVHLDRPA